MAKHVCVSVFDSAVQGYGRPFFAPSAGAAVRSFRDEVNREANDNVLFAHPEDFELRQLGVWDDETGQYHEEPSHPCLLRGKDAKITPEGF